MLQNFRRWCRRCVAVFTAVGAAITLQRRQMLLKKKKIAVGYRRYATHLTAVGVGVTVSQSSAGIWRECGRSCTMGTFYSLGKRLR